MIYNRIKISDESLEAFIRKEAESNGRSIVSQIVWMLTQFWKAQAVPVKGKK